MVWIIDHDAVRVDTLVIVDYLEGVSEDHVSRHNIESRTVTADLGTDD